MAELKRKKRIEKNIKVRAGGPKECYKFFNSARL